MSHDHTIKSSQFIIPMEGWCTEKSESAMKSVANLVDHLSKLELPLETRDAIRNDLHNTVVQVSRLWAFSCGANWKIPDADTISRQGHAGFEKVGLTYENSFVASAARRKQERAVHEGERAKAWAAEVRALLAGDRGARTLIYEKLAEVLVDDWAIDELRDLTERLTMGELEWDAYVEEALPLVTLIEEIWVARPPH